MSFVHCFPPVTVHSWWMSTVSPPALKRLLRRKETIYENIKDLDFEYKMGKLSDEDYQRLHQDYLREAYGVVSQIESIQPEPLNQAGKPQVVAVLKSGKSPKKSKKP